VLRSSLIAYFASQCILPGGIIRRNPALFFFQMPLTLGFSHSIMPLWPPSLPSIKPAASFCPSPFVTACKLAPGDTLDLETEGERITLRPVRQKVMLKKELGVWVYQGEPTDASIPDLIDRDRENRNRAITESVTK